MQNIQVKYQSIISVHEQKEDSLHKDETCVSLEADKNVVSLSHNKKVFKAKFEASGAPLTNKEFYAQIKPTVEHSFGNGKDLAVLAQGFYTPCQSILIGNYNTPGGGVVHSFIEDLEELLVEGDSVKLSYLNIASGSIYDYFKAGEKDKNDYGQIKFGLVETKRSFTEMTQIPFESVGQMMDEVNRVLPYRSERQNMSAVSRICIPIIKFEITKNNNTFTIEFYDLPNTEKVAKTCPQNDTLKQITFKNNCVATYSNVLRSLAQKNKMIPFRDSLLTKMLKPYFFKNGGNVVSLVQCINSSRYNESILETLVLNKFLRRINKAQGLPTSRNTTSFEAAIPTKRKSENFFSKHPKFQDMKLQAQALLQKAKMINDRIKDLEDGSFQEGGLAYEGLDQPIANLVRNAQNVSDVSNLIKNEYFAQLASEQQKFCESED